MKFQKSSRIIAIALAVVMILPLISVMAFADGEGEATSNVIFKADFENYELVDGKFALDAKDDTFNQGAPNGNANCQWNETKEKYTSSGNYVVKDPKATAEDAGKGQVWLMPIHENLDNNNFRMNFATEGGAVITVSQDVLVPTGAVGTVQYQFNGSAGSFQYWMFIVAGDDGSLAVDFTKASAGIGDAVFSKSSLKMERDVWNTITMQIDTANGNWVAYINGNEAAYGVSPKFTNNATISAMYVAKPFKANNDKSTYKGDWYFDNFVVTKGAYEKNVLWNADFESFTLTDGKYAIGADDVGAGKIWNKNPNTNKTVNVAEIVADPAGVEGNQVYAFLNDAGTYTGENFGTKPAGDALNACNFDNNNNRFQVPNVKYTDYKQITLSWDMYIPKTATASILWQWAGKGTTAAGAEVDKTFNDWLVIEFTEGDAPAKITIVSNNAADDSDQKVLTGALTKDTWHNVATSFNLENGEIQVYVDGKQAFRGTYALQSSGACTKLNLSEGGLIGPKIYNTSASKRGENKGWTYFDNMKVTEGGLLRQDIQLRWPEGTYYVQDFQGYTDGQDVSTKNPDTFIVNSKVVEAHKAVVDPTDAEKKNIVWWRPLDDAQGKNDDPWACMGSERANYLDARYADLSVDYYLPADATGYFQVQLYGAHSGSTGAYMHLWDINVTDGVLVEHYDATAPFTASDEEACKLTRDAWHTVRTIIDLEAGTYDVFIDGKYAASGHILGGAKNIIVSKNYLDVCCLRCSAGGSYAEGIKTYVQSGYVLVDDVNFKVFGGSVVKVDTSLADGVLGTKVGDKLLEAGVHVFDEAVKTENVNFDKTPFANLFKSTIAEFRLVADGDEGIRFVTEIDATVLAALLADTNTSEALVKKGTIIIPANYVTEGVEVTFEYLNNAGIDYLDVTYEDLTAEYAENKIAGSIYNIKTTNMNREFIAVPYVQVTLPHGNTLTIYGAASEGVTVAELAAAALANTTATYNGVEKALLKEYADKVKAD